MLGRKKQGQARRMRMMSRKTSVGLNLKGEGWRVLRPTSREGTEKPKKRSLQLLLRKMKPRSRWWSKRSKIRKLPPRKGLSAARVAKNLLALPRHHRSALRQPSLATLTTRGRMKTDIRPRRSDWTSPQGRRWRRQRKKTERRRMTAAPPLGEGAPGPRLPPRTLTTARAGRSTA